MRSLRNSDVSLTPPISLIMILCSVRIELFCNQCQCDDAVEDEEEPALRLTKDVYVVNDHANFLTKQCRWW